jgi:hypothetical protein
MDEWNCEGVKESTWITVSPRAVCRSSCECFFSLDLCCDSLSGSSRIVTKEQLVAMGLSPSRAGNHRPNIHGQSTAGLYGPAINESCEGMAGLCPFARRCAAQP